MPEAHAAGTLLSLPGTTAFTPPTLKADKAPRGRDPPRPPWTRPAGAASPVPRGGDPRARPPVPAGVAPQVTSRVPFPSETTRLKPVCELGTAGSACPLHRRENRGSLAESGIDPDLQAPGASADLPASARERAQVPSPARDWKRQFRKGGLGQTTWLLILILLLDVTSIYSMLTP